ncbi:MAG: ribonuclease P protein component [bacterium]|nr:ribonuclease P protein component [bacterium]
MGTARFRQSVLTGKHNLDQLFGGGRFLSGPGISIRVLQRDAEASHEGTRFVVCVSRKTGKAVRRNRLRRITRESLDPMIPDIRTGHFVALFPGRSFSQQTPDDRSRALSGLLKKARLLNQNRDQSAPGGKE